MPEQLQTYLVILLTVADIMAELKCSESFVRKALARGELQYIKIGANVRVRRADFDAWLAKRTVPALERE